MRLWWVIALVGFLLSVFTQSLAETFLHEPLPIFGSWFGLDYALNSGMAFGVILPRLFQSVLIGFAFGTILWFSPRWVSSPLGRIGMGCIVGGGAANIIDRLRDGVVTDFIALWPFPLFNVADMNITLGALLLIFGELWPRVSWKALAGSTGRW